MAFSVVMPVLEMARETGKVISWRKKEGDPVSKGEPLLEIETDKAVMEIEAPADGLLAGVSAQAGAEIAVGSTLAWIIAPGETPPAPVDSDAAAKIARTRIEGHSTSNAAAHGRAEKSAGRLETPGTLAGLMAERTTMSWRTVPHFFLSRSIKAAVLNRYRAHIASEMERAHKIRVTHTHLLIAITARTLLKHPRLNASWTEEGILLHDHVNMGIAVAVKDGVVATVVPKADRASIQEIATRVREVAERARANRLRPSDIAGATFTVSNLGMYGVDTFSAIINPPQAAVLAIGSVADRVVAVEGSPAVRQIMNVTLSCDHRVADGVCAANFLNDLAEAVEAPDKVLV